MGQTFFTALRRLAYGLLFHDPIRFLVCKIRWRLLKGRIRLLEHPSAAVGADTLRHNLSAFAHNAVFGMGRRMSLLLFPVAALLKDRGPAARVLIVGPRTEDDILWARSIGLVNTTGLDLFTYSGLVGLGDIHRTDFPDDSFDAVLLGWMISYSTEPEGVVRECRRILKPGGFLGIGIESNPSQRTLGIQPPRVNALNSARELIALVNAPVAFTNDPYEDVLHDCAVVFKILKPIPR
jgi:SAM-dependent methyltransferase